MAVSSKKNTKNVRYLLEIRTCTHPQ